jgi:hypothetical protein
MEDAKNKLFYNMLVSLAKLALIAGRAAGTAITADYGRWLLFFGKGLYCKGMDRDIVGGYGYNPWL